MSKKSYWLIVETIGRHLEMRMRSQHDAIEVAHAFMDLETDATRITVVSRAHNKRTGGKKAFEWVHAGMLGWVELEEEYRALN